MGRPPSTFDSVGAGTMGSPLSTFDSQRFVLHNKCLAKYEHDLGRSARELERCRSQLHHALRQAKEARDSVTPLSERIKSLEDSLAAERMQNEVLQVRAREREAEYERSESVLRTAMAAAAVEHASHVGRLKAEFDALERHARKGCVLRVQRVQRGQSIRVKLRRQRAAATTIQATWRGATDRRRVGVMRDAAVTVQTSLRMHHTRMRLKAAIVAAKQRRLRGMLDGIRRTSYL
jgi:chromosome segregation ATPase